MAAFGIDFGTTNTAVVLYGDVEDGHFGEGNAPFPSLIALHPTAEPIFGAAVKRERNQLLAKGYYIISSFKSLLGSNDTLQIGEQQYSPMDITALFLSYVKSSVEKSSETPLTEAVIAIPVDFTSTQRDHLRQAAHQAGIRVKALVSEPSAAYGAISGPSITLRRSPATRTDKSRTSCTEAPIAMPRAMAAPQRGMRPLSMCERSLTSMSTAS